MKKRKKQKIKLSGILFIIGGTLLLFLLLFFSFRVQQSALNINVGGDKGITIGATGISETTLIIIFSIAVLTILAGFIIKFKFENSK